MSGHLHGPLGCRLRTDFVAKVGGWQQTVDDFVRRAAGFDPPALTLHATPTLRDAQNPGGWRSRDQRCESPQVLSDGGQNKFILGTSWAAQSKPSEPEDALQMREPHLDLLALTP